MGDLNAIALHLDAIQEGLTTIAEVVESRSDAESLLAALDEQRKAIFAIRDLLKSHSVNVESVRQDLLGGINNELMSVQISLETIDRSFRDTNRAVAGLREAIIRGSEVTKDVVGKIESLKL